VISSSLEPAILVIPCILFERLWGYEENKLVLLGLVSQVFDSSPLRELIQRAEWSWLDDDITDPDLTEALSSPLSDVVSEFYFITANDKIVSSSISFCLIIAE
jgi:hypothetical protein